VLPPEHRVAALGDAPLVRELPKQPQGLVIDAVLRVVEEETGALGYEAGAAVRVLGKQLAQVLRPNLGVVTL
jgi:hypothetical protein